MTACRGEMSFTGTLSFEAFIRYIGPTLQQPRLSRLGSPRFPSKSYWRTLDSDAISWDARCYHWYRSRTTPSSESGTLHSDLIVDNLPIGLD